MNQTVPPLPPNQAPTPTHGSGQQDGEPPVRPITPGGRDPFGNAPAPLPGGGCSKPVLIGCGALFLILGIAAVVFLLRAKDLLSWSLRSMTPAVLQNAAPDVTAEDRARFERAVEGARRAISEGRIDAGALQALQGQLMNAAQSGKGKLTRPDFLALTEAFERLASIEAPAGGATGGSARVPAAPLPAPLPQT